MNEKKDEYEIDNEIVYLAKTISDIEVYRPNCDKGFFYFVKNKVVICTLSLSVDCEQNKAFIDEVVFFEPKYESMKLLITK